MEVAFEAKLITQEDGEILLDEAWFKARLEQCRYLPRPNIGRLSI